MPHSSQTTSSSHLPQQKPHLTHSEHYNGHPGVWIPQDAWFVHLLLTLATTEDDGSMKLTVRVKTKKIEALLKCETVLTAQVFLCILSMHLFQSTYRQGEQIFSQLNVWLRGQRTALGSVLGTLTSQHSSL